MAWTRVENGVESSGAGMGASPDFTRRQLLTLTLFVEGGLGALAEKANGKVIVLAMRNIGGPCHCDG